MIPVIRLRNICRTFSRPLVPRKWNLKSLANGNNNIRHYSQQQNCQHQHQHQQNQHRQQQRQRQHQQNNGKNKGYSSYYSYFRFKTRQSNSKIPLILSLQAATLSSSIDQHLKENNTAYPLKKHLEHEHNGDRTLLQEPTEKSVKNYILARLYRLINRLLDVLGICSRVIYLVFVFSPILVASPLLIIQYPFESELVTTRWWYTLLVYQMERAGPTFVKLAQWAGSRQDLFPPSLCSAFSRLHSHGRAHSLRYTKKALTEAFGADWRHVLHSFNPTPIGVGAVAQVYSAQLSPSDDRQKPLPIAIKVLHPHVERIIHQDLAIMTFIARLLTRIPSWEWLSLVDEVEWFGGMMRTQLDLRNEAKNLELFRQNFEQRDGITFPKPFINLTSKHVLVEEYVDGIPLRVFISKANQNHDKVVQSQLNSKIIPSTTGTTTGTATTTTTSSTTDDFDFDSRLARLGLDAFLNMLLLDNFVHADLHPGNIFVKFRPPPISLQEKIKHQQESVFDGKLQKQKQEQEQTPAKYKSEMTEEDEVIKYLKSLDAKDIKSWNSEISSLKRQGWRADLALIDTGLAISLSDNNRHNFLDLFAAVASFDGDKAGQLMVQRSSTPETVLNPKGFQEQVKNVIDTVRSQTMRLDGIVLGDVLTTVLSSARDHHVRLEGEFVNVILGILLMEGVGRTLEGDLDLFAASRPVLRQLGRRIGQTRDVPDAELGLAMVKTWAWIEARDWARTAGSEAEVLVRLDRLMPTV